MAFHISLEWTQICIFDLFLHLTAHQLFAGAQSSAAFTGNARVLPVVNRGIDVVSVVLSDVISIEKTGEHFRLIYDVKGRFTVHRITAEEAKVSWTPGVKHAPLDCPPAQRRAECCAWVYWLHANFLLIIDHYERFWSSVPQCRRVWWVYCCNRNWSPVLLFLQVFHFTACVEGLFALLNHIVQKWHGGRANWPN